MKRDTLWERIIGHMIEAKGWVNGGEIERLSLELGYKASNGSRRCREMVEEKILLREERKGEHARSVWYCINSDKVIEV